jgi:hypothetical protein
MRPRARWPHGATLSLDDLVRWTVEYFNRQPGYFAFQTHSDRRPPAQAGVAEVEVHWKGHTEYYEIKLEGDRISPAQQAFALNCLRAVIEVRIITSPMDVIAGGQRWPIETGKLK